MNHPPHLVAYGDFSCPFSALASQRAEALEAAGSATIEWHPVQHLPHQPMAGKLVHGDLASMFENEVEQVRSLLGAGEKFPLTVPPVQPNTGLATAAFAAASPTERRRLRQLLFGALWFDGSDIGDRRVLAGLGAPLPDQPSPEVAIWQTEWEAFDKRTVPMLLLSDGRLSRGLGALRRLADLMEGPAPSSPG